MNNKSAEMATLKHGIGNPESGVQKLQTKTWNLEFMKLRITTEKIHFSNAHEIDKGKKVMLLLFFVFCALH